MNRKKTTYRLIIALLLLCVIVLLINFMSGYVLGVSQVPTPSMENTVLAGDRIAVGTIRGSIERNEIIVFNDPAGSDMQLLKRVIGLPGDTVLIRSGIVYINGSAIAPPAAIRQAPSAAVLDFPHPDLGWTLHYFGPVVVPQKGASVLLDSMNMPLYQLMIRVERGEEITCAELPTERYVFTTNGYFVLGDSRTNSIDSRHFGFVSQELLVGRALMVVFSRDPHTGQIRWGDIGKRLD